jgi:hypothetical protein
MVGYPLYWKFSKSEGAREIALLVVTNE